MRRARRQPKIFGRDDTVQVQREVGAPWEIARYLRPVTDMRGWHSVELPPGRERRIDSMTGLDTDASNPRGFVLCTMLVPTRRIRPVVEAL